MIGPPTAEVVVSRYGIKLQNCNLELGQKRHCDSVLLMDMRVDPWREFFVRASILHPDSNWQLFVMDYHRYFDVAIYGNNRYPLWIVAGLLKPNGIMVDVKNDVCYKRSELE